MSMPQLTSQDENSARSYHQQADFLCFANPFSAPFTYDTLTALMDATEHDDAEARQLLRGLQYTLLALLTVGLVGLGLTCASRATPSPRHEHARVPTCPPRPVDAGATRRPRPSRGGAHAAGAPE